MKILVSEIGQYSLIRRNPTFFRSTSVYCCCCILFTLSFSKILCDFRSSTSSDKSLGPAVHRRARKARTLGGFGRLASDTKGFPGVADTSRTSGRPFCTASPVRGLVICVIQTSRTVASLQHILPMIRRWGILPPALSFSVADSWLPPFWYPEEGPDDVNSGRTFVEMGRVLRKPTDLRSSADRSSHCSRFFSNPITVIAATASQLRLLVPA